MHDFVEHLKWAKLIGLCNMNNGFLMYHICNDMLKENGKFSQGRIYLLVAIVVYYLTQFLILIAGLKAFEVDKEILASVADAIEYPMTTFATYTLGGKVVEIFKKNKNEIK